MKRWQLALWISLTGLLSGCGLWPISRSAEPQVAPAPGAAASAESSRHFTPEEMARWEKVLIPGKVATRYALAREVAGAKGPRLQADAQSSASMLRHRLRMPAEQLQSLRFSWRVEQLLEGADMGRADKEDSPVRLVLAFDGDKSRWSARTHMINELAHALTGEDMPFATLMYVWSNHRPVDSVIHNPRTDRVRKIVVQSGSPGLRQWLQYERDIRADYRRAFGEEPGALLGVAIMTDTDNTRTQTRAWYGPIALD